ncbi:hypothetical protein POTOM_018087 [Populus tomentosa]|uniref:Damage-control phosphatase ARMT1-like metal-binding domain-containing protein n=1 Tax=Populus tomentosa TaxID=118781 RepID=A0A8X8A5I0_POPTO|nr:hypothetical protein POTOM_018087 [Populus tomentosa]
MESESEMVAFPLLLTPIETNYRACTIPYRFPSDNPKKATPTELQWINLFLNSIASFKKRAETDSTVPDAPLRAEKFAQRDGMSFLASSQNLVPRPWVIDDLDTFKVKWSKKTWKKVVIFVDNSGADIILGILPFARELLRCGSQVVLAANDMPSINDVTYTELIEIIAKLKDENGQLMGVDTLNLLVANSGNDLPVIDLTRVSQELAYLASDADLVILEGMGRGIETNLYAQFKCDSLKIGMVKHPEVAQFLGGRLYDCVFKYNEAVS